MQSLQYCMLSIQLILECSCLMYSKGLIHRVRWLQRNSFWFYLSFDFNTGYECGGGGTNWSILPCPLLFLLCLRVGLFTPRRHLKTFRWFPLPSPVSAKVVLPEQQNLFRRREKERRWNSARANINSGLNTPRKRFPNTLSRIRIHGSAPLFPSGRTGDALHSLGRRH